MVLRIESGLIPNGPKYVSAGATAGSGAAGFAATAFAAAGAFSAKTKTSEANRLTFCIGSNLGDASGPGKRTTDPTGRAGRSVANATTSGAEQSDRV
jgi:hypothetical protein